MDNTNSKFYVDILYKLWKHNHNNIPDTSYNNFTDYLYSIDFSYETIYDRVNNSVYKLSEFLNKTKLDTSSNITKKILT